MAQQVRPTITVDVPEGMTSDQLKKLVTTYVPKREKSKNRDKAKRKALTALIKAHQPEYDKFLAQFKKQFGVVDAS